MTTIIPAQGKNKIPPSSSVLDSYLSSSFHLHNVFPAISLNAGFESVFNDNIIEYIKNNIQ